MTASMLTKFLKIFDSLAANDHDVDQEEFTNQLMQNGFTYDRARGYINQSIKNGMIYERKSGVLAKS